MPSMPHREGISSGDKIAPDKRESPVGIDTIGRVSAPADEPLQLTTNGNNRLSRGFTNNAASKPPEGRGGWTAIQTHASAAVGDHV